MKGLIISILLSTAATTVLTTRPPPPLTSGDSTESLNNPNEQLAFPELATENVYDQIRTESLLSLKATDLVDGDYNYIPLFPNHKERKCSSSQFQQINLLGKGGISFVWLAMDLISKEQVILKTFDLQIYPQAENVFKSIRNEEVILKRMVHPSIPSLRCSFIIDSMVGLVMESFFGVDLYDWRYEIRKGTFVTNGELRLIVNQLVDALEYLHRNNIIHRDVKPENVIVTKENKVYLIDYDCAIYAPRGATGIVGTKSNLAPEILSMKRYYDGVDWYDLGLIIYELATEDHPFDNEASLEELKKDVLKGIPLTGRSLVDDLISHLSAINHRERWSFRNGSIDKIKSHPLLDIRNAISN